jgi:hypothetical protein
MARWYYDGEASDHPIVPKSGTLGILGEGTTMRVLGFGNVRGAVLVAVLSGFWGALAQGYTPVTVVVTDPSGAVVSGAYVTFSAGSPGGGNLVADERGRVSVGLEPGKYHLRVTAQGYSAVEREVEIHAAPQTITVSLNLGGGGGGGGPHVMAVPDESEPAMPMHSEAAAAARADTLVILGAEGQRGVFTAATFKDYPHQTVTIFDHHTNAQETYSGVPLMELLAHLGVPKGKDLMGKVLADYVVATGSDGDKSVVALGEIDPEFHPGMVLVADTMDGKPLDKTGPFRLVVSEDKRPARSVRNLVKIEVRTAE